MLLTLLKQLMVMPADAKMAAKLGTAVDQVCSCVGHKPESLASQSHGTLERDSTNNTSIIMICSYVTDSCLVCTEVQAKHSARGQRLLSHRASVPRQPAGMRTPYVGIQKQMHRFLVSTSLGMASKRNSMHAPSN